MNKEFAEIFRSLRTVFSPYRDKLVVVTDIEGKLYLDTNHIMKNKKPLFFGSVEIKKNYVSFHLMPVYVNPDLLQGISESLRRRMQGKSCFNFKKNIDTDLLQELASLTKAGFDYYVGCDYCQE